MRISVLIKCLCRSGGAIAFGNAKSAQVVFLS